MRGDRRPPPGAAPCPGKDDELHVCINIPGLNRAASQERLWPSRVGRCEGPPHSYVRMPFGLPNTAVAHQRYMPAVLEAHEARRKVVQPEEVTNPHETPGPLEPHEVWELDGS